MTVHSETLYFDNSWCFDIQQQRPMDVREQRYIGWSVFAVYVLSKVGQNDFVSIYLCVRQSVFPLFVEENNLPKAFFICKKAVTPSISNGLPSQSSSTAKSEVVISVNSHRYSLIGTRYLSHTIFFSMNKRPIVSSVLFKWLVFYSIATHQIQSSTQRYIFAATTMHQLWICLHSQWIDSCNTENGGRWDYSTATRNSLIYQEQSKWLCALNLHMHVMPVRSCSMELTKMQCSTFLCWLTHKGAGGEFIFESYNDSSGPPLPNVDRIMLECDLWLNRPFTTAIA